MCIRDRLGIIGEVLLAVRFSPGPVKNKFAIRVKFKIQQRGSEQPASFIPADEMPWQPAGTLTDALMPLQSRQEFMAEKGILLRYQGIPFSRRYLGQRSEAARQWFAALWHELRPVLLGRTALSPRIWNT